jgi:hypothetical protein
MKYPWIISLCVLWAAAACNSPLDGPDDPSSTAVGRTEVPIDLSLSVKGAQERTKADYSIGAGISELVSTQSSPQFRGMERIRLLAFNTGTRNLVSADSRSLDGAHALTDISDEFTDAAHDGSYFQDGLVNGNHSHVYSGAVTTLPEGTSSVLVYGCAPRRALRSATTDEKHLNGSLIELGWDQVAPQAPASTIRFAPDPIASDGIAEAALNGMANLIRYLMSDISFTQQYYYDDPVSNPGSGELAVPWGETLEDPTLRGLFLEFVNNSEAICACGLHLELRLTNLYKALKAYDATAAYGSVPVMHGDKNTFKDNTLQAQLFYSDLYNGLKETLLNRFNDLKNTATYNMKVEIDDADNIRFTNPAFHDFPTNYGLPDGAVRLRWNGTRFVISVSGTDGNVPLGQFCYMPPLYYFANTNISTTLDANVYKSVTSDMSWSDILGNFRQGKIVTAGTRSVALDKPLQYACAMLSLTVKASSAYLPDKNSILIPLGESTLGGTTSDFPVTGIIISGQYEQRFDFSPVTDDASGEDLFPEYFLYDNHTPGMYLTKTQTSAPLRTLVFPTPKRTNVFFFLEFLNNTNQAFEGRDGTILPGFSFYLLGAIDLESKLEEPEADQEKDRAFLQDHYTALSCEVSSLENAYMTIPALGEPMLKMGIRTRLNWLYSPGSYVILE